MSTYTPEQLEAVQHAVERVGANWDGATEGTVEQELRSALSETGVAVDDGDVVALAHAVEENRGTVSVESVLARGR